MEVLNDKFNPLRFLAHNFDQIPKAFFTHKFFLSSPCSSPPTH